MSPESRKKCQLSRVTSKSRGLLEAKRRTPRRASREPNVKDSDSLSREKETEEAQRAGRAAAGLLTGAWSGCR